MLTPWGGLPKRDLVPCLLANKNHHHPTSSTKLPACSSCVLVLACLSSPDFRCWLSLAKKRKVGSGQTEEEIISKTACCHGNRLSNAFLLGRCRERGGRICLARALLCLQFVTRIMNDWRWGWGGSTQRGRQQPLQVRPILMEPADHGAQRTDGWPT